MKSAGNFPWRVVLRAVLMVALGAGCFLITRWMMHPEDFQPKLTGVAQEMRMKPAEWSKAEKDGTALLEDLRAKKISAVGLGNSSVLVSTKDGEKYFVQDKGNAFSSLVLSTAKDAAPDFQVAVLPLASLGVRDTGGSALGMMRDVMGLLLPVALVLLLVHFMRGELSKGPQVLEKPEDLKFTDVVGAQEAKAALQDVVAYMKDSQRYAALGARPPAGVLMLGGPGVGKTLLAKALAGECGANFIATNGSDFTSKFYGVGVEKVKRLFALARKNAPCIIFIDEIDGIAKRTSGGSGPAESESNRIVNQVLVEMDGFASNEGIVVVGATNLADNLDEALLREGRFDRRVSVKLPDVRDRADILRLYAKKVKVAGELDYQQLARLTTGMSPATLAYVVNHAALLAARKGQESVTNAEFMEAIETAQIGELNGAQRALTEAERRRIAVHEAGHAVVAAVLGAGKVEKVTILPRGGALGVTLVTQDEDKTLHLHSDLKKRIQMLLGGRNAELAVLDEASTGAGHDLQEASRLALDMVGRYGFGDKGELFSLNALPAQLAQGQVTACVKEANRVLEELNIACQRVLEEHRNALDALTAELLRDETVNGERVLQLCGVAPREPAAAAPALGQA